MSKVAKTTILLMIITMLSKVLGFIREIILMNFYGLSYYSDVYITTMNIPIVMFAGIGTALATTFIPIYYEVYQEEGEKKSLEFVNNVFNIIIIITLALSILGFIFAKEIIGIFAIGFKDEKLILAIKFIRVMIVGIVFIAAKSIITAYLQIKDNFKIPGLIGLPYNIIIIISIVLSVKGNIYILAIGTLLAMLSQFMFQLPFAIKYGYKYKFYININDKNLKKMIHLVMPVFIGVAVTQINVMIDRTIASTLGEGSIAALNSANRLNEFVMGMFIATLASVIYPMLSKASSNKDNKVFFNSIKKSINSVVILVTPISIGAIVLANPIVKLLFERGAFDSNSTKMTSIALMFYSVGMLAFGIREILNKVFYSMQDTKTPMINGALSILINIIFNIILSRSMGYAGLAFATSISAIVCVILLFINLKRKIGYFEQDKIIKTIIKTIIAAIIMGIITYYSYNVLNNILGNDFIVEVISLLAAVTIGAIMYGVLIILFKVEEINLIKDMFKKKINKLNY